MLRTSMHARRQRLRGAGLALALAVSGTMAGAALVAPSADAATQSATFTADAKGVVHYRGPAKLHTGLLPVIYKQPAAGGPGFEIWRLKAGYTWKQFKKDATGSPTAPGFKRLLSHSFGYGGLATPGTGKLVLDKPGHYVAFVLAPNGATLIKNLNVTGRALKKAPKVTTAATVSMRNSARFGGASTLPAKGTIRIRNNATDSPHFLMLQHVADGTTRAAVVEYFATAGPDTPPPSFMLPGGLQTGSLSTNHWQTVKYSLPKGTYVEMCFFPDPKTGMPHAMMGMVRIVTIK